MTAADTGSRRASGARGTAGARLDGRAGAWLLAAVAVGVTIAQLAAVSPRLPFGWDEVVYVSQFSARAPAAYFSAPRARGITWLAAPAVVASGSVVVVRLWMSLLSALALAAAYWPWRRLAGGGVAALAAGLFGGLWVVRFYAAEVMPNLYVACGAVAATGWMLRAVRGPGTRWRTLPATAASVALVALIRPPDAVWLALALLGAAVAVPAWRRWAPTGCVVAGTAVGLVPWLVESYQRFGGPPARLRGGSEVEGGMGLHWAAGLQWRAVNGPMLCRPCTAPPHYPLLTLWWLLLPVLAVAGPLLAARRWRGRAAVLGCASVTAAVLALQYLFLLDYAATRFLMPSYALLALPAAAACVAVPGVLRRRSPRAARAAGAAIAVALAAHLVSQDLIARHFAAGQERQRQAVSAFAVRLNGLGLRPPCALVGAYVPPVAWYAGCSSEAVRGNNVTLTRNGLVAEARRMPLAVLQPTPVPAGYAHGWKRCAFTLADGTRWYVFRPPRPARQWAVRGQDAGCGR